jgi:hypothetical protein
MKDQLVTFKKSAQVSLNTRELATMRGKKVAEALTKAFAGKIAVHSGGEHIIAGAECRDYGKIMVLCAGKRKPDGGFDKVKRVVDLKLVLEVKENEQTPAKS